ncbi:MAG: Hpt domain-containing protein [Pirellulaceae bacterium]
MTIDMNKFRETFFVEAEEHLESMESALLSLENNPGDPELLNQIFRAAHTIKGASSTFGVEQVSRFTHVLENLLDRLRAGELNATADLLELLLNATDTLTALVEAEKVRRTFRRIWTKFCNVSKLPMEWNPTRPKVLQLLKQKTNYRVSINT